MTASTAHHIADFALPTTPAGRCLHEIRIHPGIDRTQLRENLNLSQASIARHVTALIDAELVEQRFSTTSDHGRTGRPGAHLFTRGGTLAGLGAHIGVHTTELVAVDAAGDLLASRTFALTLPGTDPTDALEAIAHALAALLREVPGDNELSEVPLGLAFSAHVAPDGTVSSSSYEWIEVAPAEIISTFTGTTSPIPVTTGVRAMAAHELLTTAETDSTGSVLYVYSREMVTHTWIFHGEVHHPRTGKSPAAFEKIASSGSFGVVGKGPHPLGTTALLQAAHHQGIPAKSLADLVHRAQHSRIARNLLDERAHLMARLIGLAADVVDPDAVIVAGDAFTTDPHALASVGAALDDRRELHVRSGESVLSQAAITVALADLWADPLRGS